MNLTVEQLRAQDLILLEIIAGSKAYGLDTPQSDTDIRGVFVQPKATFYGFSPQSQVAEDGNDVVFYELGRFIDLLAKNNPNILELLFSPAETTLYRHPCIARIRPEWVLSKLCLETFAGYARAQIGKAFGLNKKTMNPMDKTRKSILEFCWIVEGGSTRPLLEWLAALGWNQADCGLVNLPHMRDAYALYHAGAEARALGFNGVAHKDNSNNVSLSSVPKGSTPAATMSFNKDGYSVYCKEYLQYWDWVEKRNEARYATTISHGKNYDSKNMMHTFRLLAMAEEIATEGQVHVRRPDRDFLFTIRRGEFEYEDLMRLAEERLARIGDCYAASSLPEVPAVAQLEQVLVELRAEFYR
jgi:uncharacterized protein